MVSFSYDVFFMTLKNHAMVSFNVNHLTFSINTDVLLEKILANLDIKEQSKRNITDHPFCNPINHTLCKY